jgi:dinuclear metal center YbgI/SA1388 family protein
MSVSCQSILQALREFAPPRFALDRDPTGLQVGTADKQVDKVLCCLDLTLAVAEEARALGAGLVVSHHAVIFRPLKTLRTDQVRGKILEILIKHDIAVYVPHTALDVTVGGLNDRLAEAVGLVDPTFLDQTGAEGSARIELAGLTPEARARASELLSKAGSCWPSADGVVAAVPARRAANLAARLERELGVTVHHAGLDSGASTRGIGRIGALPEPESARALGARLKAKLGAPFARVAAADVDAPLSKVAVLCGDGRSFLDAATFAGADALVSGDIDHHTALEGKARGLALIDLGHWATERDAGAILADALRARLEGKAVSFHESQVAAQPFTLV